MIRVIGIKDASKKQSWAKLAWTKTIARLALPVGMIRGNSQSRLQAEFGFGRLRPSSAKIGIAVRLAEAR